MQLLTIGYEGFTPSSMMDVLNRAGAQTVVDVRELPLSRKKGFSKNSLRDNLVQNGMEYFHIRNLGCPRDIRHDYRDDRDWPRYTVRFLEYLSTQDEAMALLKEMVEKQRCCLLCYEADFETCHRSFIADRLRNLWIPTLEIKHLTAIQIDSSAQAQMPL